MMQNFSFHTIKALIKQKLSNTLVQNSIWAILAQLSLRFFGTLIWIMIARALGAEQFGYFSFVLAFCMVLELLPNWGHNMLLVRIFKIEPSEKHEGIFLQAFYLKILLSIAALIIAFISFRTIWADEFHLFPAVTIGLIFVFFKTSSMIWEAVYTAHEKLKYSTHMVSTENIIKFLLILLLYLLNRLTIFNIMLIYTGSFLAKYLAGWWLSQRTKIMSFESIIPQKPLYIKMLLIGSLPFVLTSAANYIYTRIDVLMLSRLMVIPEELGWYGLISNLIVATSLFGVALATAFFPTITRLAKEESEEFLPTLKNTYTFAGIFGFLIATAISLTGGFFIPFFFGETYQGSIPLVNFFIFVLPLEFWKSLLYRVYYARHQEKKLLIIILVMIGFNILANWVLGTIWGYIGIGIATFLSKILVLLLCILGGKKWIRPIEANLWIQFLIYLPLAALIIRIAFLLY